MRLYNKIEFFKENSVTCEKSFSDWRPEVKKRRGENWVKKILSSPRGKALHYSYAIIFFDVLEEDVEKELVDSKYKRIKIEPYQLPEYPLWEQVFEQEIQGRWG